MPAPLVIAGLVQAARLALTWAAKRGLSKAAQKAAEKAIKEAAEGGSKKALQNIAKELKKAKPEFKPRVPKSKPKVTPKDNVEKFTPRAPKKGDVKKPANKPEEPAGILKPQTSAKPNPKSTKKEFKGIIKSDKIKPDAPANLPSTPGSAPYPARVPSKPITPAKPTAPKVSVKPPANKQVAPKPKPVAPKPTPPKSGNVIPFRGSGTGRSSPVTKVGPKKADNVIKIDDAVRSLPKNLAKELKKKKVPPAAKEKLLEWAKKLKIPTSKRAALIAALSLKIGVPIGVIATWLGTDVEKIADNILGPEKKSDLVNEITRSPTSAPAEVVPFPSRGTPSFSPNRGPAPTTSPTGPSGPSAPSTDPSPRAFPRPASDPRPVTAPGPLADPISPGSLPNVAPEPNAPYTPARPQPGTPGALPAAAPESVPAANPLADVRAGALPAAAADPFPLQGVRPTVRPDAKGPGGGRSVALPPLIPLTPIGPPVKADTPQATEESERKSKREDKKPVTGSPGAAGYDIDYASGPVLGVSQEVARVANRGGVIRREEGGSVPVGKSVGNKGMPWWELAADNIIGLDNEYESAGERFGKWFNQDEVGALKQIGSGIYEGAKEFVRNPIDTTKEYVKGVATAASNVFTKDTNDRLQEMYGVSYEEATDEQVNKAREAILGDVLTALEVVPGAAAAGIGVRATKTAIGSQVRELVTVDPSVKPVIERAARQGNVEEILKVLRDHPDTRRWYERTAHDGPDATDSADISIESAGYSREGLDPEWANSAQGVSGNTSAVRAIRNSPEVDFEEMEDFGKIWGIMTPSNKDKIRKNTMTNAEWKAFQALPDTITIYRGIQTDQYLPNALDDTGASWTWNKEFAKGWVASKKGGKVLTAQVKKEDIITILGYQDEVVIDPSKVKRELYDPNKPPAEIVEQPRSEVSSTGSPSMFQKVRGIFGSKDNQAVDTNSLDTTENVSYKDTLDPTKYSSEQQKFLVNPTNIQVPKSWLNSGKTKEEWLELPSQQRIENRWETEGKPVWKLGTPLSKDQQLTMTRIFFDSFVEIPTNPTKAGHHLSARGILGVKPGKDARKGLTRDDFTYGPEITEQGILSRSKLGVVTHESGHAIDSALNSRSGSRSTTAELPKEIMDELSNVTSTRRGPGTLGLYDTKRHPAEVTADAFAMLAENPETFKKMAPKSFDWIKERINNDDVVKKIIETEASKGTPLKSIIGALTGLGVSAAVINGAVGNKVVQDDK